jgi:hypothetical protein
MSLAIMPTPRRRLLAFAAMCALGLAALLVTLYQRSPVRPSTNSSAGAAPVQSIKPFTLPHPRANPELHLRPEVREALGIGVIPTWTRRLDLVRALPSDLTTIETDALLSAMMEQCPPSLYPAMHSTYIHEIACILQHRQEVRERFSQVLATLARDTRRDQSTRDYAIQHLRQVWTRASEDPALRTAIVATFREFTSLDPVVSTPALLSLHLLGSRSDNLAAIGGESTVSEAVFNTQRSGDSRSSIGLPDSEIAPLLQPILAATTSVGNIPARLTALRIAGERRMSAFRNPLLAALKDPSEHTLIRMAAANALGKIADPADLQSLASYEPKDARVGTALRFALQTQAGR